MREVAVIPAGYRKHAQPIQNAANCNRLPGDARPDRCDATCMDGQKRNEIRIHDLVLIQFDSGGQAYNLGCFRRGLPPQDNSRSVVIAGSNRTLWEFRNAAIIDIKEALRQALATLTCTLCQ